jgi:hypothetical protein
MSRFPSLRSFHRIWPSLRPCVTFRNKLGFYGKELLAPRPTPQLKDHPSSAPRDCYLPYLEAVTSIRNLRTRHAVVTGAHLT